MRSSLICLWLLMVAGGAGAGGGDAELTTTTESEDSVLHPDIFAVHWVHIPKAAGSAFTRMVKRVACEMNPELRDSNPCCQAELCLSVSCATSTSGWYVARRRPRAPRRAHRLPNAKRSPSPPQSPIHLRER